MAEAIDKGEEPEFKWGKFKSKGGKSMKVKFYESFTYDGVDYRLHDSVYLYKEGEPEPYIGKIVKIWENPDKAKKVKVLWYFRPCEIANFLEGTEVLDNELFLASGEGLGLSNVNPLEAIAGKCNVVCISKDSRNLQPSDEEVQLAEFVFYRFFDVGQRKILGKLDDKIAELEVKNIFNSLDSQKPIGIVKLGLDKKDISGNATQSNNVVASSQPKIDTSKGKCLDTLVREIDDSKPSLGEKPNVSMKEKIKSDGALPTVAGDKALRQSKVEENGVSKASLVTQNSSTKLSPDSRAGVGMGEAATVDEKEGKASIEKTISRSKVDSEREVEENGVSKASLVKQNSSTKLSPDSRAGVGMGEAATVDDKKGKASIEKTILRSKVDSERDESKVVKGRAEKINKGLVDSVASQKEKHDVSCKVLKKKIKNNVSNQRLASNGDDVKTTTPSSLKEKYKLQRVKDSCDVEDGPSKKLKTDKKLSKFPSDKFCKETSTIPTNTEHKLDGHATEVTRRPDVDRSKWFKEIPWEEKLKNAHERGTLVLLENLDPSLTSEQVQDIIFHGFKENCTAYVIQKTASASPHSGQAFVIFKRRETADMVVRKLDKDCLLMSNGRPLVGSIGRPHFPGKKPIFYGHHCLDQLRMHQREMKDAISTSHCSQPNNIEYDMAMEWCLLQKRAEKSWRRLYERQGLELRKLKAKLNTKI